MNPNPNPNPNPNLLRRDADTGSPPLPLRPFRGYRGPGRGASLAAVTRGAARAQALRDFDGAMLLIKKIRTEHPMQVTEPLVEQAVSAVDMAVASQKLDGEVPSLEEALAKDAGDHAARAKLATALFGRGQYKAAMDHALEASSLEPLVSLEPLGVRGVAPG